MALREMGDEQQLDFPGEFVLPTEDVPASQDGAIESEVPAALARPVTPVLSIIVPTKNEAANIPVLLERLASVWGLPSYEIIFADDSDDETPETVRAYAGTSDTSISVIHREPGDRATGLGGAVLEGMRAARGDWLCVMDGDLQHPPELVVEMFYEAAHSEADIVVASRYRETRTVFALNAVRRAASNASSLLARGLFRSRLTNVSDPMSGFFLVRASALDLDRLHPRGFKILLEILAKHPELNVTEVGFEFGKRHAGESKATFAEGMTYLSQLGRLRMGEDGLRFLRFLLVGASGFLVNALLILTITSQLGLHYLISAIFASWGSTTWNFLLVERWVFTDRSASNHRMTRFLLFFALSNVALAVREPIIYVLTAYLSVYYVISNFVTLVALTVIRYGFSDAIIWKRSAHKRLRGEPFSYDIHGIVSVNSEVWLPELERFLTHKHIETPTINVRINKSWFDAQRDSGSNDGSQFIYDEGFGPLGFGIDVSMSESIDIAATPLLRRSPHVLYTNVVEPILRWTFTRKGYALVHGACIAFGSSAYLVTARTDTGKTTTILRILDRQRRRSDRGSFISDDLTLLAADGRVLTYPKPLTISRHTVAAVRTPLLSRSERVALFIQSRLHSREGRQFAFRLASTGLPVATINGVVQWIVPPPKYHIQRLVPHSRVTTEASLAGVFVIERGEDGEEVLSDTDAIEILMRNSDDAYGFPPYTVIKKRLTQFYGSGLETTERSIVTAALTGMDANLVRSSTMNWSQRIPELAGIVSEDRTPYERPEAAQLAPA